MLDLVRGCGNSATGLENNFKAYFCCLYSFVFKLESVVKNGSYELSYKTVSSKVNQSKSRLF